MKTTTMLALFGAILALGASAAPKSPAELIWDGLEPADKLYGNPMEPDDLFDMVVVVGEFKIDKLKDFPFDTLGEQANYALEKRLRVICSLQGSRLNAPKFKELLKKNKLTLGWGVTVYQDACLATTNRPAAESYPFFYVVDTKGAVIYKGTSEDSAISAAKAAVEKLPRENEIFGIFPPNKLLPEATNYFRKGVQTRPGMAWLKRMSMDKDPEKAAEAAHMLVSVPQKRDLLIKDYMRAARSVPGETMWKIEQLFKMWPDLKSDKKIARLREEIKEMGDCEKVVKIVIAVEKEAQKPVLKSAEAKRAALFYKANIQKLERLAQSKDPTAGAEATRYMPRVEALANAMLNWTPPER
ncbi:MAG: hypothetical protein J6P13_07405 [Kiritimatiellae bacterium]|nr:hypothetical protein [Kiritimatiellia bacterium]